MTVTYLPPLSRSGARPGESLLVEPITEGPAYLRGPRMGRWHRIRSAVLRLSQYDGELHESYALWCGQHAGTGRSKTGGDPILTDNVPTGEPSCGTCEGRAIGADPERPDWLYSPENLQAPARCPGSSTLLVVEDQDHWRHATCLVCGDIVRMRARGGALNGHWDAENHQPGPGLIPGCPFHAWRELVRATTRDGDPVAACRCQTIPTTERTA